MMRVTSIALVLVACGAPAPVPAPRSPTAPPPSATIDAGTPLPLDRDLALLAQRSTRLYQDVVAVFASAGGDCAAATAKLGGLQTTYADVVAANAKVLHDGRARELRAALEPHADALDAAAKAIVGSPTMSKCSPDHAFTDAFDNLVGAPP
ncbi:MAG: hypothetical protein IPQ07_39585 [Myxococcales bacterium]|nr:hypothetical protein [Myxococcales bacterium]